MDGYASAADEDDTQDASRAAFKAAEQVYRLSWTQAQRCRGSNGRRSRCAAPTPPATPAGYPGLLDLGPGAALPPDDVAVAVPAHGLGASVAVHRLTAHPGAFHVTGALSAQQQLEWAHLCLTEAIEPPATTNHTQQHGSLHGIWHAAVHDDVLDADGRTWRPREAAETAAAMAGDGERLAATALLRRLRWAALGTPYDWSSRSYVPQADIRAVGAPFTELANRVCTSLVGHQLRGDVALVNLYATGCMLSGHVDDAEAGGLENAPVVSISLGCPALLLLQNAATTSGCDTTAVTPLLLRSGDLVVLAGQARRARHGVPRVFTPLDDAPSRAAAHEGATAELLAASAAAHGHTGRGVCGGGSTDACLPASPCARCLACVPAWLRHNRINISIRDMEPGARLAAGTSTVAPSPV